MHSSKRKSHERNLSVTLKKSEIDEEKENILELESPIKIEGGIDVVNSFFEIRKIDDNSMDRFSLGSEINDSYRI